MDTIQKVLIQLGHKDLAQQYYRKVAELDTNVYFHSSPNGDLRGSFYGLHIGSYEAAKEAIEARIGVPARGEWDGSREYNIKYDKF